MLNKKFINTIKKKYDTKEQERRKIISEANIILHDSKRVIFSLHRGDFAAAELSLDNNKKIIKTMEGKFGVARLYQEGSYKAAVEEYAEAKMLYLVMSGQKIESFKGINFDHETYLGGMCDLVGELVRRATNEAAVGKYQSVSEIGAIIQTIMTELVKFDMTGYLRTKYDQARSALRKMEQINYEISIRK